MSKSFLDVEKAGARDSAAANVVPPLAEILAPGLAVVFCGLNPATSAVRDGYNFSNRSNRFWPVLHLAGFTPRPLRPEEERELLAFGCGITSAVSRATKSADELTRQDYLDAAPLLEEKVRNYAPGHLAFLGKAAYRAITSKTDLAWGRQPIEFAGAKVWLLPNPSGLNRAFSLTSLAKHYRELRCAVNDKRWA